MEAWSLIFVAPFLLAASPGKATLASEAAAGHLPIFERVLDAGFDPDRKAEFEAFVEWIKKPKARGGTCGFAEHRAVPRAMARAVQLSKTRAEASKLWKVAENVASKAARRAQKAADIDSTQRPTPFGREIARRVAIDQAWRSSLYDQPHGPAEEEVIGWLTWPNLCRVDAGNTRFLKAFAAKNGWPKISEHGADAAEDAWLLVQHADADRAFQKEVLKLMVALLPEKEVSPNNYAYLFDRVAIAEKRPQRYGTQFTEGPGGCLRPSPLEDPKMVDTARKSVGLPPIAEYAKQLAENYHLPICSTENP